MRIEKIGTPKTLTSVLAVGALAASLPAWLPAAATVRFESPPTFQASKLLPAELLSGPHHRVQETVVNDGFMNAYEIESSFGPFEASSDAELRIRVAEIAAIARLDEVSRSEQFAKGVGKAGQDILSATAGALTDPVDTLKDTAGGVKEIFSSASRTVRGEGGGGIREAVGYGRAKRQYAIAFGVDPYSTNPVLQDQLSRVSRAGFAGDMGAGTAAGLVSGGAGVALSTAGHLKSLEELVEDKSPAELRELNQQKLDSMGVDASVSERFLDNDAFSPTQQTAFVGFLEQLKNVGGRGELVRVAASAPDADESRFRVRQARMYSTYHEKVARLGSFVPVGTEFAARTKAGLVVAAPTDYVVLSSKLSQVWSGASEALQQMGAARWDLWVAGGMSPTAKSWLQENGWTVHTKAKKRLLP